VTERYIFPQPQPVTKVLVCNGGDAISFVIFIFRYIIATLFQ